MSQAAGVIGSARTPYIRVVGVVSAAHFVSHYYIILLAPLMPFVRAEYEVSYTEIGLAFAAFNIVSAVGQTLGGRFRRSEHKFNRAERDDVGFREAIVAREHRGLPDVAEQ